MNDNILPFLTKEQREHLDKVNAFFEKQLREAHNRWLHSVSDIEIAEHELHQPFEGR